jgi:hypothetical protein
MDGHVALIGRITSIYRISVGKPKEKPQNKQGMRHGLDLYGTG